MPSNTAITLHRCSAFALLWALGGFGDVPEHPIDQRNARMRQLLAEGVGYADVAERLGVKRDLVRVYACRWGLSKPRPHGASKGGRPRLRA